MAATTPKETIIHKSAQPLKIILTQSKGNHFWEISAAGESLAEIMPVLKEADSRLKKEYGPKGGKK